jgi:hypothetical protein
MGKLRLPIFGTEIVYDNPKQVNQNTLRFANDITPYLNAVPGAKWEPNFAEAIPQPTTFEEQTREPETSPVMFNQQPKPLTSAGIKIPGTTVVFRNPA